MEELEKIRSVIENQVFLERVKNCFKDYNFGGFLTYLVDDKIHLGDIFGSSKEEDLSMHKPEQIGENQWQYEDGLVVSAIEPEQLITEIKNAYQFNEIKEGLQIEAVGLGMGLNEAELVPNAKETFRGYLDSYLACNPGIEKKRGYLVLFNFESNPTSLGMEKVFRALAAATGNMTTDPLGAFNTLQMMDRVCLNEMQNYSENSLIVRGQALDKVRGSINVIVGKQNCYMPENVLVKSIGAQNIQKKYYQIEKGILYFNEGRLEMGSDLEKML